MPDEVAGIFRRFLPGVEVFRWQDEIVLRPMSTDPDTVYVEWRFDPGRSRVGYVFAENGEGVFRPGRWLDAVFVEEHLEVDFIEWRPDPTDASYVTARVASPRGVPSDVAVPEGEAVADYETCGDIFDGVFVPGVWAWSGSEQVFVAGHVTF